MRLTKRLLVTGGSGFIGSAFIRFLMRLSDFRGNVINVDKLTYAANPALLKGLENHPRYRFVQADINHRLLIEKLCEQEEVDAIVHFAAETHVDRSIADASAFLEANVKGTLSLLEVVRRLPHIHFHHVSTDEVYGSLGESGSFNEQSPYRPNSPYAASKAASDHFVRAFAHTHRLSTTISHCSNNYGPGQHPEKFIPLMITSALAKKPLPVYGRGSNVRDWLYVEDHADALWRIVQDGKSGQTYDIGGGSEMSNLDLLHLLLKVLSQEAKVDLEALSQNIRFVQDRPGHDYRYAIDSSKIRHALSWSPKIALEEGLKKTIRWHLAAQSAPVK